MTLINKVLAPVFAVAVLFTFTVTVEAVPSFSVVASYAFPQLNNGSSSALTYDGTDLLFLTQQSGSEDIYFLNPISGAVNRSILPSNSNTIGSMAWDGTNIRAANVTAGAGDIRSINPISGTEGASIPSAAGNSARVEGMAFDGASLFLTDTTTVFEVNPTTGAELNSFAAPAGIYGLTFGGGNVLYGAARDTNQIIAFNKSNGTILFDFLAPGSGDPHGLAFDGTHLFVADQASNTIFVLQEINPSGIPEPATSVLFPISIAFLLKHMRSRARSKTS